MQTEIDELAEHLFSKPPGEAYSYQLEMDLLEEDVAGIAGFLVHLFSKGVKQLFSVDDAPVDISELQPEHVALLQKYFVSIGFQFQLIVNAFPYDRRGHFDYLGEQLKDVVFNLYRGGFVYKLIFDFVPLPDTNCAEEGRYHI